MDLALNNQQLLIFHKTKSNQSKTFDSIHWENMKQLLQAYGLRKESLYIVMMLDKNTETMVRSADDGTDILNIVTGVLQWDNGWLVGFLWHINFCRLFNAKSIFMQIISSISNNSAEHEYTI